MVKQVEFESKLDFKQREFRFYYLLFYDEDIE